MAGKREKDPKRRERILEAAVAAFSESPGAGIREIAERAGCADGTIYHHFGDRAGLIRALIELLAGKEAEGIPIGAEKVRARLSEVAPSYRALAGVLPDILSDASLSKAFLDGFALPSERAAARGMGRGEAPSPELRARLLMASIVGVMALEAMGMDALKKAAEGDAEIHGAWAWFVETMRS
jgi:AcrR family transcriptional regulator